ncbi:guanitoxin biosynthesis heme-dependent pre-guanitoxin N-hydroxylase GntA [Persicitalea sp.]|uniref:guanitoxin biosynthesis heme-dependent pre-guanitoxin N-hydroxylase GntA n=1 Tax=Persicitalea sp. TaxID=3100273 RepID=UPI00359419AD
MVDLENEPIIDAYKSFLGSKVFPCVAAKAALAKEQVQCFVADHMACPNDDTAILQFLYAFVDRYREAATPFHSAAVLFKGPQAPGEETFEVLLWQRLQMLVDLDAALYPYDPRVSDDSSSPEFGFSLKGEAFFVIGLHPRSSRPARQFAYPALVFNPHAEFEKLRTTQSYEKMKDIVRKKDIAHSGSINPMLTDFGTASDVYQYSGRQYGDDWQCPLKLNHARPQHHSAP